MLGSGCGNSEISQQFTQGKPDSQSDCIAPECVLLNVHPDKDGCYLHGSVPESALPETFRSAVVEDTNQWTLEVDGNSIPFASRSAVAYLRERENIDRRSVWFGLEVTTCPSVTAKGSIAFAGKQLFEVQFSAMPPSVFSIKAQPVIVEGNGLTTQDLPLAYVTDIMSCVAQIWQKKCRIKIEVAPTRVVRFPFDLDAFYFLPLPNVWFTPVVVSQSAQSLYQGLSEGSVPVFIANDIGDTASPLNGFGNYAVPASVYEEYYLPKKENPPIQQFWFKGEIQLRVDHDFSLVKPEQWQTKVAANAAKWIGIFHSRRRFPVTFSHEFGHILGLPHPEESQEIRDDDGPNIMKSSGYFKKQLEVTSVYQDVTTPEEFGRTQCEQYLSFVDISPYQCLVTQLNIPSLQK